MQYISEHESPAQAYQHARSYGSTGDQQDLSFLDEWHSDDDVSSSMNPEPSSRHRGSATRSEWSDPRIDTPHSACVSRSSSAVPLFVIAIFIFVLGFSYLTEVLPVLKSLLRHILMWRFLIAVLLAAIFIHLAFPHRTSTTHRIRPAIALERRQSWIRGSYEASQADYLIPGTLYPAAWAVNLPSIRAMFDHRTYFHAATESEDDYFEDNDIVELSGRRQWRPCLAHVLSRQARFIFDGVLVIVVFVYDFMFFQVYYGSCILMAFNFWHAMDRGEIWRWDWVPWPPTSWAAFRETLWFEWDHPVNVYFLRISRFWYDWSSGLSRIFLYELPKAVWTEAATRFNMVQEAFVNRS